MFTKALGIRQAMDDSIELLSVHIHNITGFSLNQREKMDIKKCCCLKILRRKQLDQRAGDMTRHLTFVLTGAMRMYAIDERGRDHTLFLAAENCWIYDPESLRQHTGSKFFIEATKNCTVLQFSTVQIDNLRICVPLFRKMITLNNLNNLITLQKRFQAAISMLAEERYEQFVSTYPSYAERFSQHIIASYLGMTFETLSRIRKQKGCSDITVRDFIALSKF
jgi:CRP-like cAMP-binding protein